VQVSRIMGIEVLDHVIIGKGNFVSLKEMGKL
jgi:DNA repair protein RadC